MSFFIWADSNHSEPTVSVSMKRSCGEPRLVAAVSVTKKHLGAAFHMPWKGELHLRRGAPTGKLLFTSFTSPKTNMLKPKKLVVG